MIIISQNLTINTQPELTPDNPRILVDNVFQLGTVSASSERPQRNGWLENAVDGMTYDWWEWLSLPAWLSVQLSVASPVDMCAIGLHTGITFIFQYHNGSAWVDLHEPVTTTTTAVHAVIFTEIIASQFRVLVTQADDENILGIVMLGKSLQLPKRFYGGHAPIVLNRTTQIVRNKTESGFDAGVYSLRTGAATNVSIDNMRPIWIRENLEALNKQLERRPFIFAWRPATYPSDVAYCWLNSPITAQNNGVRDLMTMQFDVNAFIGGGIVAPIIERLLIGNRQSPWLGLYEDAESALTLDSSPDGLTETTDCSAIAIHRKGIIAASFFQGGAYTYEYRNGVWTAMTALTDLVTWNYGVDIHPDEAKWMVLGVGFSPFRINLYRRFTDGLGANAFYFEKSIPGINYCKFSPDGELVTTNASGSFIVSEFDADTGILTNATTYAFSASCFAWSADSTYLAVCNLGDTPRLKIYKRDFYDNSLAELTADVFWPKSPPSTSNQISNNLAWHPEGEILIVGTDSSTFVVYKNDGEDEFNDVTTSVVDVQPGLGGKIYAVEWSPAGSRLYVGISGGSINNLCIYDYANGLLIRRSTQLIGATANAIGDIQGVRFSTAALSVVEPDVDVAVLVFDEDDNEITLIGAVGDYTIRPQIVVDPDIDDAIVSVRFFINETLIGTATASPFEFVFSVDEYDDLETFEITVEVIDAYGRTHTEFREYLIDLTPPWTPAELGPAAWYDPQVTSSLTLSGDDLTSIADLSGNGRTLTFNGTRPGFSASGFNSLPAIVFTGGAQQLITSNFDNPSGADGITIVFAARRTGAPVNFSNVITKGALNTQWSVIWASPGQSNISYLRNDLGGSNTAASPSSTLASDTDYIYSGTISNAAIKQYLQGVELSGSQGSATRSFGSSSALSIPISGANWFQGALGGIILIHQAVSDANREKLEGWLAHRCGIASSLYVGHPYRDNPPDE
jgi:hypothetical protein